MELDLTVKTYGVLSARLPTAMSNVKCARIAASANVSDARR
jgi:hypothetical protein